MTSTHLAVMFRDTVASISDRPATRVKVDGQWQALTYGELGEQVRRVAAWLVENGVAAGDKVVIFSQNRPEWTVADFALLSINAVSVPIYPTLKGEAVGFIVNDSGSKLAFAAGAEEVQRLLDVAEDTPGMQRIVSFDALGRDDVVDFTDIVAGPASAESLALAEAQLTSTTGDELASIIYTSGTTGIPKGVMLSHRGFAFQVHALHEFFNVVPGDVSLSFLPLSHALERAWTFVVLTKGAENVYVQDARKVAEFLPEVKPNMMASVPRLYEKVYLVARDKVSHSPLKTKIFEWALRVGGQCQRAYRKGKVPNLYWRAQLPLADSLVLKNIREAMGGPKKVMACGGAPVRQEIEEFFSAAGMLLLVGYGLTEASPLVTFPYAEAFKIGTCGRVVPGGEIKIGAEGEILYRGPNVMLGYWNQPEDTAACLDEDGWLHTGDIGYVDVDEFLVITDRLKDLIVTSGGKNVAPAPIEGMVLADPLFENAVLIGDNRPYLTMLVSPSLPQLEDLARSLQLQWERVEDLFSDPQVLAEFKRRVGVLTEKVAHHEQIRDLRVAIQDFSQENGLLTPTLKVKRREVERRFAKLIDEMYSRVGWRGKE